MESINLQGAEQVQSAARQMQNAADSMNRAAGSIDGTLHVFLMRFEGYVMRMESAAEMLSNAPASCDARQPFPHDTTH